MIGVVLATTLTIAPPARPGVASVITLSDADGAPVVGATIAVVQRPGLSTEKEAGAGITDSQGKVRWTPELSGPALVYAGEEPVGSVAVAWSAPPPSSLVPLALLLVVGGAATAHGLGPWRRRS